MSLPQNEITLKHIEKITEENTKVFELPAGTKISVCLQKHGEPPMDLLSGNSTTTRVGNFTLQRPIRCEIAANMRYADHFEFYLKPCSDGIKWARRVLDKLSDNIILPANRELCENGQERIINAILAELESDFLRDNPEVADEMKKQGLTTTGFDVYFHFSN